VLPQLRALPGFLGITLMQAERGDSVEIVVSSRLESMAAIRAFSGLASEAAVVEPAARAVLVAFDDFVSHYEVTLEAGGGIPSMAMRGNPRSTQRGKARNMRMTSIPSAPRTGLPSNRPHIRGRSAVADRWRQLSASSVTSA